MRSRLFYLWALPCGLYYYALFQVMHAVRFGGLNTGLRTLDLLIVAIGVLSVVLLMYLWRKLVRRQALLLIAFLIALPLSYIGALGGGLLGAGGLLVFGLVPFGLALPVGYGIIKRLNDGPAPAKSA
jgi:hypothetical protein